MDRNGSDPVGHSSSDFASYVAIVGSPPSGGEFIVGTDRAFFLTDFRSPTGQSIDATGATEICWEWVNGTVSGNGNGNASTEFQIDIVGANGDTSSLSVDHGPSNNVWEGLCVSLGSVDSTILAEIDRLVIPVETVTSRIDDEHFGIANVIIWG